VVGSLPRLHVGGVARILRIMQIMRILRIMWIMRIMRIMQIMPIMQILGTPRIMRIIANCALPCLEGWGSFLLKLEFRWVARGWKFRRMAGQIVWIDLQVWVSEGWKFWWVAGETIWGFGSRRVEIAAGWLGAREKTSLRNLRRVRSLRKLKGLKNLKDGGPPPRVPGTTAS
jgi:hypothetical protein